jgi:hypothetical protein
MRVQSLVLACLIGVANSGLCGAPAWADCRRVGPSDKIVIDDKPLRNLGKIGLDRQLIFSAVEDVSIPETGGCWAGATGNFDGQIVSVGVLQFNYGQNSLQPVLKKYRASFRSDAAFQHEIKRLMPNHGRLIFSEGCLRAKITDDCKQALLRLQSGNDLNPSLKPELNALFESDRMIQIQMDRFVAKVEGVKDDLRRIFGDQPVSARKIKWAIDTKVQQGGFPGDQDIERMRAAWKKVSPDDRHNKIASIVRWYEGLSNAVDQDGIRFDWKWNVDNWRAKIGSLTDEQIELINLTFLRSRTAKGESGRWQANTFQRRATIIFGVGSVAGHKVGGI